MSVWGLCFLSKFSLLLALFEQQTASLAAAELESSGTEEACELKSMGGTCI